MVSITSGRGFTLIETLVASSLLITALAGIAQLFVLSAQWARHAALANEALLAAQGKLEELSSASFNYGAGGEAITAAALQPSPAESLRGDLAPYVDWLDAAGQRTGSAAMALLTRRWRVSSDRSGAVESITVEVCVFRAQSTEAEACLATIRVRQS